MEKHRTLAVRHKRINHNTHVVEVQDPNDPARWSPLLYSSEEECLIASALYSNLCTAKGTYRVRPSDPRASRPLTHGELVASFRKVMV